MISFERLNHEWNNLPEEAIYFYKIGPFTISISSTDKLLADKLTRAFAHLEIKKSPADLTIRIWSGFKLPFLEWSQINTNGYRGYAKPPIYFHYFKMIEALSAVHTEQNIAYYAVKDVSKLPWWVNGSPLQVILHVWFQAQNMQLIHSASIANSNNALLLAGKGGSGKSTTVLACLHAKLSTLGEDYHLVGKNQAYSIYQTAKWLLPTRHHFPSYESYISNPATADQEKALVYYKDIFPSQIVLSSPISAIVSIQVGASSSLQKSDYLTSLRNLLLSTAAQLPHTSSKTTLLIKEFAEPLSHYQLTLGPNLQENVNLLRRLLQ